jgi:hypothetical protein
MLSNDKGSTYSLIRCFRNSDIFLEFANGITVLSSAGCASWLHHIRLSPAKRDHARCHGRRRMAVCFRELAAGVYQNRDIEAGEA